MSFDKAAAKKAGYLDTEIQDFLKKENLESNKRFDASAAKEAGYTDQEIKQFLSEKSTSRGRSLASAPLKGAIKGAEELGALADPTQILINQIFPKKESLTHQVTEQVLPTQQKTAEQFLERAGKLLPATALGGQGLLGSVLQSLSGAALGQIAKEEGAPNLAQEAAELIGVSLPGSARAIGKKALSLATAPIEKLPSGLSKPRALDSKFVEKAIITPEKQKSSIEKLNKEASRLAGATVEKELPLAKQIQQGHDFESQFEKRFSDLEKLADKANPEIDISPVSKFFSDTSSKYRGIPKLHPEATKIKSEIRAFSNLPQTEMSKLLKIYRSNNKKIKGIYETSRLTGKQQEYVDFLVDYNKALANSFEKTLPSDSFWLKEFKSANQDYKQWKDTLKTLQMLKPVLEGNPTPQSIMKLADDARSIKKLELSFGKKGAQEISQIAKDLKLATDSIKKMSAKDIKWYEGVFPLSVFVPYIKGVAAPIAAKKYADWARRGYGWFLSTPARRLSYNEALKALAENNRAAYIKATESLQKSLQEEN